MLNVVWFKICEGLSLIFWFQGGTFATRRNFCTNTTFKGSAVDFFRNNTLKIYKNRISRNCVKCQLKNTSKQETRSGFPLISEIEKNTSVWRVQVLNKFYFLVRFVFFFIKYEFLWFLSFPPRTYLHSSSRSTPSYRSGFVLS